MPSKFLSVITDSIAASWNGQHYLVDCANRTSLPNIEFYFGEAKLTMTLDDYSWTYFVSIFTFGDFFYRFVESDL